MKEIPFGAAGGEPCRILLAEDDAILQRIVTHILTQQGFQVVIANDGEEALDQIRTRRPDAIILDAMMPGMDGLEVLHEIRKDSATHDIPVMMLSVRNLEKDLVTGFDMGANDYLVKPFKPEDLVARLKRLLNTAQQRG